MRCWFFYTLEQVCEAVPPHIHGHCSVCGGFAISYWSRWTHVGEPCAPRRDGKWIALHGEIDAQFVTGRAPESQVAA